MIWLQLKSAESSIYLQRIKIITALQKQHIILVIVGLILKPEVINNRCVFRTLPLHRKLQIWSDLLEKSLMENFISCVVYETSTSTVFFKINQQILIYPWLIKLEKHFFFLESKNTFSFYIKLWKNHIWSYISNFMIFFHEITKTWRF